MLFSTRAGREAYFKNIDQDPASVPFGTALAHAVTTSLGIWGVKKDLREDVARIMACEVTKAANQGDPDPSWTMPWSRVLESQHFQNAYALARNVADGRFEQSLRALKAGSIADVLEQERFMDDARNQFPENALPLFDLLRQISEASGITPALEQAGERLALDILEETRKGPRPQPGGPVFR